MRFAINDSGDVLTLGNDGQWAPAPMAQDDRGSRIYFDGKDWQPTQRLVDKRDARAENSGIGGYVRGAQRAIENGLTFGLRDEMGAAIDATVGGLFPNAGTWSERYGRALGRERARQEDFSDNNPVTAAAGNIFGGLIAPMPLFRAAPEAGLVARSLRAAGASGVGGAAAGFGEAEGGPVERLTGAATGAAVGAATAPALQAGINAGGKIAGRLLDVAGLRNPGTAADRQILRALERDGIDPHTFGRPQAGVPAAPDAPLTLADQGGRNVVGLAAVAANTPGRAMEAADAMAQARREARPERIAQASNAAFGGGSGTDVAETVRRLGQQRATQAAPLYRQAFEYRVTPEQFDEIARFVRDPIGQDALNRGLRVIELEYLARGEKFDPAAFGVTRGEAGKWMAAEGETPNVRLLDAVKRGYDEIVEGFRDPTSGRLNLNQYGRAVNDVRAAYRDQLAGEIPAYGDALQAWAGPSASLDALAQGRRALTTDRDVVAGITQRLSDSDRDFFRVGVGRAVSDMAGDPARAATAARRLLEDRNMQARLDAAIPDPAQRAQFRAALEREVDMAAVERAVSPRAGSQTARLQAGQEDMGQDPPGGLVMALLNAGERGGVGGATARGLSVLYRRGQGINSSTADALAQRLLSADAAANATTAERLAALRERDIARADLNRQLVARLLQGVGVAGGLAAN